MIAAIPQIWGRSSARLRGIDHPRSSPATHYHKSIVGIFMGNARNFPFCLGKSMGYGGAVSLIATRLRLAHEGSKRASSGGKRLPLGQGGRAADLVSLAVDEMALLVKMVVHAGVNRSEFL